MVDGLDYVNQVGAADERIATSVGHAKGAARAARAETRKLRRFVAAATRAVQARTEQVRAVRDQLVSNRRELVAARSTKRVSLTKVRASERQEASEAQALEEVSASLGAQIQAAQSASSYSPPASRSSSGFIWPVSGPVTSPFGMRWGRMHTGIDIADPAGTPIHAAKAGEVIYAGWLNGYGNTVVVDHGDGIATLYGHQSRLGSTEGQQLNQGDVLGFVGSTGHSTGNHLHFEVRINTKPVNPRPYLP